MAAVRERSHRLGRGPENEGSNPSGRPINKTGGKLYVNIYSNWGNCRVFGL